MPEQPGAESQPRPAVDLADVLVAMEWERDEALKRADQRLKDMVPHATFLACESADRLAWRMATRYVQDVGHFRAELEQCRQQLAEADVKDVYMQARLTYQCGRADAAESLADTFVEKIKTLKAQLAAAEEALRQIKEACRLDAERESAVQAELATWQEAWPRPASRLDAAQQEPLTASKKSERCDCPECQQGFALGVEPATSAEGERVMTEDPTVAPNAYPVTFEMPRMTDRAEIIMTEFRATARDPRNRGFTQLGWFTAGWEAAERLRDA